MTRKSLLLLIVITVIFQSTAKGHISRIEAQVQIEEPTEIFLSFRFQGGVNTTIIGQYRDNTYYLPVLDLFRLLIINHRLDNSGLVLTGNYLSPNSPYEINFNTYSINFNGVTYQLDQSNSILSEFDMYLETELFSTIFGLDFEVDFSSLILRLSTSNKLPVVQWAERERARQRLSGRGRNRVAQYPVLYDRDGKLFNGGFLDYTFSGQFTSGASVGSNAGFIFGGELLYGDVQGIFSADLYEDRILTDFRSLRYRYVPTNGSVVKQIFAGNVGGEASNISAFEGVRFTNNPLVPDRTFDTFILDEVTVPDADVELLINGALVDFTKADETGRFSFPISLTYGVNDIKVVIYGPNGELLESERRFDIPFNYVRSGTFRYDAGAGYARSRNPFQMDDDLVAYFTGRFSLLRSITNSFTVEHINSTDSSKTIFTTDASVRLRSNLLLNIKASPGYNYRADGYIQTNSGLYLRAYGGYTEAPVWPGGSEMNHDYGATAYVPFRVSSFSFSLRAGADISDFELFKMYRYNAEINTRIRRFGLRLGARDFYRHDKMGGVFNNRQIQLTQIYSFPLNRDYPLLLRGLYTRMQLDFSEDFNQVNSIDVNLSKSIFTNGRFQVNWQHNLRNRTNSFYITFSFDFRGFRSNSAARINQNQWSASQTFRGSVSVDTPNERIWFTNRNMTGYAAVSPIMYVDSNENGHYDKDDTRITENAVRLIGTGSRLNQRGSHTAITQLQPYYRYDVEVMKSALRDPFLIPALDNFSIVTDPNQYKRVEIPMVRTGLIDGQVVRNDRDGTFRGIGGLRLNLVGTDTDYKEVYPTFLDGSFYMFEIPPGEYELSVDANQLAFMNVVSVPSVHKITIKSLPDGDFVEGLLFELQPKTPVLIPENSQPLPITRPEITGVVPVPAYDDSVVVTKPEMIVAKVDTISNPISIDTTKTVTPALTNTEVDSTTNQVLDNLTPEQHLPEPVARIPEFRVIDQTPTNYTSYDLQVGAFDTEQYAVSIAERYSQRTGYNFVVMFNPTTKKHTVRIQNIANIELVRHIQGMMDRIYGIKDAFIINIEEDNNLTVTMTRMPVQPSIADQLVVDTVSVQQTQNTERVDDSTTRGQYEIQLGSFQSQVYATRVAQNYHDLTGIDFVVVYNPKVERHTIRVIGFQTYTQARRMQTQIVEKLGITDSFIIQN